MRVVLALLASQGVSRFGRAFLLAGALSFRALASVPGGNDIFLTTAVKEEIVVNGRTTERWLPTEKKISFVWSDQPFAVHVPFVIETVGDAGVILGTKDYRVSVNWRGFGAGGNTTETTGYTPAVLAAGFYRFDGRAVHSSGPGRIYSSSDFIVQPPNLDLVRNARQGRPPAVLRRISLPGPARVSYWLVVDPRRGLATTAIWTTKEVLNGVFEAKVEDEDDPQKKVTGRIEFPLKQNGWAWQDAKVHWLGSLATHSVTAGGTRYRFADLGHTFEAGKLIATHRVVEASPNPDRHPVPTDVRVTMTFPKRLLDHTVENGTVEVRQIGGGDAPSDARYGLESESGLSVTAYRYQPNTLAVPAPDVFEGRNSKTFFFFNTDAAKGRSFDPKTGRHAETFDLGLTNPMRGQRPFEPGSRGTLPPDWTAEQRIGRHRLFAVNTRFYGKSGATQDNVVRQIDLYAVRLSELESNEKGVIAGEGSIAQKAERSPDDGYYEWLVKFSAQRGATEERVQEIMLLLQTDFAMIQSHRSQFLKLLWLDQEAFRQSAAPNTTGSPATGGYINQVMLADMARQRAGLLEKISELKARQTVLIEEALRITKQLVESADVQTISSRENPRHMRKLEETMDYYKDQRDITRLYLYEAAGWHESNELQQAIADMKFASQAARELAKLMEAKALLAQSRSNETRLALAIVSPNPVLPNSPAEVACATLRVRSMNALRELLTMVPGHPEGLRMQAEIELEMLGWISAKLERERRVTMAGFQRFLSQRGYYVKDDKGNLKEPHGLWEGFKEYWSVAWGTSPISVGANLSIIPGHNTAAYLAEAVGEDQEAIAMNQVSLLAIRRLVRNGLSLKDILQTKPEELARRMVLHTEERTPLDQKKAHRIFQDIHATFAELYDLTALANGNPEEFAKFLGRTYYDSFNPDKGWCEAIGDIFLSPYGLMLCLGPSAVVKVGGKWVLARSLTASEAALVAQGKNVQTVRDVFASVMRMEKMGEAIAKSPTAEFLARAVAADQQLLASQGTAMLFLNKGSRLAATIVFYCGLSHLAEESGIPGLKLLVDVVGALGPEEMAYDILSRHAAIQKLVSRCDDFGVILAREKEGLAQLVGDIAKLEAIQARMASAAQTGLSLPTKAEFEQLEKVVEAAASKPSTLAVAGAAIKQDAEGAMRTAVGALKTGDVAEAERALGAAKELTKEMEKSAGAYTLMLERTRATLTRNPQLREVPAATPRDSMQNNKLPSPILPLENMPEELVGRLVGFGDSAMKQGKLEEALDFYRHAMHEAKKSGLPEAEKFVAQRLTVAAETSAEAAAFKALQAAGTHNVRTAEALTEAEIQNVIGRIKSGNLEMKMMSELKGQKSLNNVYALRNSGGGKLYIFKHLPDPTEVDVEVFAAAVAGQLGIKVPAVQRIRIDGVTVQRRVKNKFMQETGEVVTEEAVGVLMRVIEGDELMKMSETAFLALKAEYARQRVLRSWLCDSDGHFGNIFMGLDGHLWQIDFGMGALKANEGKLAKHLIDDEARSQADMVKMAIKVPRIISEHTKRDADRYAYHWMTEADAVMSVDEMLETVTAIRKLCAETEKGKTLRDMVEKAIAPHAVERNGVRATQLTPEEVQRIDEAVQVLTERAGVLQKAIEDTFPTIKTSAVAPFPSGLLFADLSPRCDALLAA